LPILVINIESVWPFGSTAAGDDGLPSSEESWQVSEIEDLIAAALEEHHESLFAAVITSNRMREFVFYTSDPYAAEKKLAALAEKIDSHQIRSVVQLDAGWMVYHQLV
jgi:hypothetical protein